MKSKDRTIARRFSLTILSIRIPISITPPGCLVQPEAKLPQLALGSIARLPSSRS
jgi:hypothetical protein